MQSVHTILLPNGKVLSVNGSSFRSTLIKDKENQTDKFIEGVNVTDYDVINNSSIWNPQTGEYTRIKSPNAIEHQETNDLFCSGHLQLADGNVLFIGGTGRYYPGGGFTGSRQANLYNWKTGEWSNLGQLKEGRWYPSLIPLADGKIVIFSGLKLKDPNQINPSLEIYDPKTKKFHYINLTNVKNSPFATKFRDEINQADAYDSIDLYPRIFPTTDGKLLITGDDGGIGGVLVSQNSKKSYLMSIHENEKGNFSVSFEVGPDKGITSKAYGTALLDPNSEGDVLLIGGAIGTNDINFGRGCQDVLDKNPICNINNPNPNRFPKNAMISPSLQRWISPKPPENVSQSQGQWETVANFLDVPRANLEAVILPSKEILVVNGGQFLEYKPVYSPLLMTPNSKSPGGYSIKHMNPGKFPRLYHNGALLLPDARVLIMGGNANRAAREKDGTVHVNILQDPKEYYKRVLTENFNLEEYYKFPQSYFLPNDSEPFVPAEIWQGEIFSPPYLFKPGSRPEFVDRFDSPPLQITYGQTETIAVKNATAKGSLVLVKLGAVTHSFDYGQRLVDLPIERVSLSQESLITFKTPENAHLYPPGYYMMFYMNDFGKPSHSKIVKLEAKV